MDVGRLPFLPLTRRAFAQRKRPPRGRGLRPPRRVKGPESERSRLACITTARIVHNPTERLLAKGRFADCEIGPSLAHWALTVLSGATSRRGSAERPVVHFRFNAVLRTEEVCDAELNSCERGGFP
jgi:hypothetical protein